MRRAFTRGVRRRTMLGAMAASLVPGALPARPLPTRRLGVLWSGRAEDAVNKLRVAALIEGLAALGWGLNGNLEIAWRWTAGARALANRYAAELVRDEPDALLAVATPSVAALREQTRTIPIVFVDVTNPVGQGFVESLAHPGGNLTGFTDFDPPMAGKWLEMLTKIVPRVARAAVLYNPVTAPFAGAMIAAVDAAAPAVGVSVRTAPVRHESEIEAVVADLARAPGGGLLVLPDSFTSIHAEAIVGLAARHRIPAVYWARAFAETGGLMSYGIDPVDPWRHAALYVGQIFKGAKPGDLPVQNPAKFELLVNLKAAAALGVTFAPSLLAAADRVIE
ncbi:MAG TPA: ABC transporter substrate-binding protein [Stellaceae bacterium]